MIPYPLDGDIAKQWGYQEHQGALRGYNEDHGVIMGMGTELGCNGINDRSIVRYTEVGKMVI